MSPLSEILCSKMWSTEASFCEGDMADWSELLIDWDMWKCEVNNESVSTIIWIILSQIIFSIIYIFTSYYHIFVSIIWYMIMK